MNLEQICQQCKADYEKRLAEKDGEIAQLKQQPPSPPLTYDQQYLIDLCAQMANAWRPKFDVLLPGIQEIIKVSDKISNAQQKEGDAVAINPRTTESPE